MSVLPDPFLSHTHKPIITFSMSFWKNLQSSTNHHFFCLSHHSLKSHSRSLTTFHSLLLCKLHSWFHRFYARIYLSSKLTNRKTNFNLYHSIHVSNHPSLHSQSNKRKMKNRVVYVTSSKVHSSLCARFNNYCAVISLFPPPHPFSVFFFFNSSFFYFFLVSHH